MFGYVSPLKGELKVREMAHYNAYYCGLCKTISKEFGQLPRLALSYDCAFIAILLGGVMGDALCKAERCAIKPFKQKQPVAQESEALLFAADLNLALSWYKCRDDWRDERKASALLGNAAFMRAAKKVERKHPQLFEAIENGIDTLSLLEREKCNELDAPIDTFARMMRGVLLEAPLEQRDKIIVSNLAYHIGRWIYLADAWDDREKDKKSGSYNVFNITGADAERASFLMYYSLNEAQNTYALLDLKANAGILDNILYDGCTSVTNKLLTEDKMENGND